MADLITVARAKQNLNQASFSSAEDTLLANLVSAVSEAVQRHCRRSFPSTSHDEYHDGFYEHDVQLILLRDYPVITLTSVTVDGSTLASSEYTLLREQGSLRRETGWPWGYRRYRVQYTAGFATVPADVQEACAEWVAGLFWQTKDNPATYPELPTKSVRELLASFRLQPVGGTPCVG